MRQLLLLPTLLLPLLATAGESPELEKIMAGEHRSEANRARDQYRHPAQTLKFFGIKPDMTVIEISPGGGWYTDILGPYLKDHGQYVAASYDVEVPDQPAYRYRQHKALLERFAGAPDLYDAEIVRFSPLDSIDLGPAGSADMVVTFRNAHGWAGSDLTGQVMAAFFEVLKPGGVLGLVQHRAPEGADPKAGNGYVPEAYVIEMAEAAGFKLDARSEINGNPKDTHDHPEGVWTLPPSLELGDTDREKYMAIGESDRMTLRFVKPPEQ